LDEIKREKLDTTNILRELQKATENLNKATERIQTLENENARLHQSRANITTNPTPSSDIHHAPISSQNPNQQIQPNLYQPGHNKQDAPPQATLFSNMEPINQHPVTMSEVFQLQQKFAEHQLTPKFPKFNGKSKAEFKSWYDQVLAVLSSPPWNTVFADMSTKTLKYDHEISSTLSSKLFSSLRLSLGQNAEKLMMTKKHSWGQGLLYLSILRDTYKESLHRADLLKKENEFSNLFLKRNETIDEFAARCIELRDQLEEHGIHTSPEGFKNRFIMGLGPMFTTIQQSHEDDLPTRWRTSDIQSLVQAANTYKDEKIAIQDRNKLYKNQNRDPKPDAKPNQPNAANNKGVDAPARQVNGNPRHKFELPLNNADQSWIQKNLDRQAKIEHSIKNLTFNPMDYAWQVRPNKCIWHNSGHHFTECKAINNLLLRYPNQRCYKVHKIDKWIPYDDSDFHPLSGVPPRPTTTPTPKANPTARNTTLQSPVAQDVPELENNPFAALAEPEPTQNVSDTSKDNNEYVNNYLVSCRSVKINTNICQSNPPKQPIKFIVDSAAFPHMMNQSDMFTSLLPWEGQATHVTLADGTSHAKIEGHGSIDIKIGSHSTTIDNVLYVPTLSDPLFSAKQHASTPGNYVHIQDNIATLAFNSFIVDLPITSEIYLPVEKAPPKITAKSTNIKRDENKVKFIRMNNMARIPIKSTPESAGFDLFNTKSITLLPKQRIPVQTGIKLQLPKNTYGRISPRSGLALKHGIDIAAGVIDADYRGEIFPILVNNSEKQITLPVHTKIAQIIIVKINTMDLEEVAELNETLRADGRFGSTDPKENHNKIVADPPPSDFLWTKMNSPNTKVTIKLPWNTHFLKGYLTKEAQGYNFTTIENPNISHIIPTSQAKTMIKSKSLLLGHSHKIQKMTTYAEPPPLQRRIIDTPLSQQPSKASITLDQLHKSFGFRNVSSILNELKSTSKPFAIASKEKEPIIDIGEVATISKKPRNTYPLDLPKQLGDVVHVDIIYGAGTAIQGIKYALFVVDRATRHKFIYPLKSLTTDIVPALMKLEKDLGNAPKIMRTDFDHKLMGSKVQEYFQNKTTQLQSASPDHQNENGLCERNWRTVLSMSRNWLASALLPSEFWWFAMRRATEVSNYVPLKIDNILTTPHELVYKQKPDLNNLIPMFSVGYPEIKTHSSTDSQTCRAILVGKNEISHAYNFYHPATKNIITSATFRLDERLAAGPAFGLPYDGGLYFGKYCEYNDSIRPPQFAPETQIYVKHDNDYIDGQIVAIPKTNSNIYTIQYQDGSIHEIHEKYISTNNPNHSPLINDPPLRNIPNWIKHKSKCTIFLNHMDRPSQGYLVHNQNQWQFRPGHKNNNPTMDLPNFADTVYDLISTFQIFQGHQPFRKVHSARSAYQLGTIVARHVSAKALTSTDSPTLLQHAKLNSNDKQIWDAAYSEEYLGLKNLPAWITITESEYKNNRKLYGTLLPTMAISTVKYDEHGTPKRAKYRIVVLGNLDPHDWSKQDCFAPVMSLKELRLITAIAIKNRCILQSGDFKQAFVQSVLPQDETYVLRPPPGCPLTPKNTYWHLKRSLYGLKRAPRHWYNKATKILKETGLHPCPNAPCLFQGEIIPGKPTLYLGLYVDDFIFFSTDKEVEKEFERRLKEKTNVDFMGNVSHFLGLRFQWRKQPNSHLKVHLSQEAFADTLIEQAGLSHFATTTTKTPYRSGYPVDMITKDNELSLHQKAAIKAQYQSMVGSLLWLSQGTRPDLSTITNMLARHQNDPNDKHISSAKHAIKYLKGTKSRGIMFNSNTEDKLTSYLHFPVTSPKIQGISDANWGPQDQSIPNTSKPLPELELFKTRSISGHVLTLMGPLHWTSKRQKITARSSCEAEIYATDECVKDIVHLRHIIQDLKLEKELLYQKTTIYNDNMACVLWSKSTTTKGLRHLQIRENAIRETNFIKIEHICGKINPADMFTKEDKDPQHFQNLRDTIVTPPFRPNPRILQQNTESNISPHSTQRPNVSFSKEGISKSLNTIVTYNSDEPASFLQNSKTSHEENQQRIVNKI